MAETRLAVASLGFILAVGVTQASAVHRFTASFTECLIILRALDFIALAHFANACALSNAETPLIAAWRVIVVAYRRTSNEQEGEGEGERRNYRAHQGIVSAGLVHPLLGLMCHLIVSIRKVCRCYSHTIIHLRHKRQSWTRVFSGNDINAA